MKISLEWLCQYVDFNDSPDRLAEIFTAIGFPVEQMTQVNDDWMFDVEITSNRPDCLGHIGLARELAAATSAVLKLPNVEFSEAAKSVNDMTSFQNDQPAHFARYTTRVSENIQISDTPN